MQKKSCSICLNKYLQTGCCLYKYNDYGEVKCDKYGDKIVIYYYVCCEDCVNEEDVFPCCYPTCQAKYAIDNKLIKKNICKFDIYNIKDKDQNFTKYVYCKFHCKRMDGYKHCSKCKQYYLENELVGYMMTLNDLYCPECDPYSHYS